MFGTRDIKKREKNEIRPRSHRAYYLWMDKEQTKRRYQYITKQENAIHVIDSRLSIARRKPRAKSVVMF